MSVDRDWWIILYDQTVSDSSGWHGWSGKRRRILCWYVGNTLQKGERDRPFFSFCLRKFYVKFTGVKTFGRRRGNRELNKKRGLPKNRLRSQLMGGLCIPSVPKEGGFPRYYSINRDITVTYFTSWITYLGYQFCLSD